MKKILKKIYQVIPGKKFVFTILKSFYKPDKKIFQHLHFKDIIQVEIDKQHHFKMNHFGYQIENDIFWSGLFNGWEKYSLKVWTELSRNSKITFDIGANTGIYSMISKGINPTCEVHAFEPVNRVRKRLEMNNDLNGYNCFIQEKAVSNFTGTATIYDKNTEHTYSVTVNKDISPDTSDSIKVEINTIRLDDYISSNNIASIDLMKIDVETHEVEALEGMGKYLKQFAPSMLVEVLNDEVADGIEKLIKGIDYHFYNIHEINGIKKVNDLKACEHRNFLICSPQVAKSINIENISL